MPCILLLTGLMFFSSLQAQRQRANNWMFPTNNRLNFTSGNPVAQTLPMNGEEGTSAISDLNGNLVFFSNGFRVWQSNGILMTGGNNLVGDPEATQSSIIVPSVQSATRYYLFVNDANAGPNGFQYYDVEMTLNGGNGGVVGPTMLLDSATEKVCATRHANDIYYWVVAHKRESDEFHAFLVDESGVNVNPVISSVGIVHTTVPPSAIGEMMGQMKISPDGKWIATCNFNSGYVQLFRFNNATGEVSDPINLEDGGQIFPFGLEFSADSKKIFYGQRYSSASNPAEMKQFDLDHASVDCLLASETAFSNVSPFKLITDLQLGIDKKIYVGYYMPAPFNADTLGVIANPDEMCPDCNFTENSLLLANGMFHGVTNFVSSFVSDGITYEFGTNCEGVNTLFTPEDTLGLDSVTWNFGDPLSGNNTSNDINASHVFSGPDTFLVTLNAYRGSATEIYTRNVIIWDTTDNLLGPDTTLCAGQSITLDAAWYNACVEWIDSSTDLEYTTNQAGWHWVDVYHQSCVWRDSVFVTLVSQPPQFTLGEDTMVCADVSFVVDPDLQNAFFTWHNGSHDTTFAVNSTGTYWLQASNACGTTTDTLNVVLNEAAQPVLHFPTDTTGCDTVGIFLDVTFQGAVYTWNDGLTQPVRTITEPGTYWVRVGNSCDTVSDTIAIAIDKPLISVLIDREVSCTNDPNDTLAILATADSQIVVWNTGSVSASIQAIGAGTYWFNQSNVCGSATDTIRVLAYDTNYPFFIGNDTTLCEPQTVILIGDTADDYPWLYNWSTNQRTATIEVGVGVHEIRAQHRCDTVNKVVVIDLASRVFIKDTLENTVCDQETLTIGISTLNARSILWSTGDTTQSVIVSSATDLSVEIVDEFGCIQVDSFAVDNECPGIVFIPNVFTPNGDGFNDEFCLELDNIVEVSTTIFNRWGVQVAEYADQPNCWDGNHNGNLCAPGVYFYIVSTTDAMGKISNYRGSFTLIGS